MYRIFIASLTLLNIISCTYHDLNKKFDCTKSDLTLMLDSIVFASGCGISDGGIYITAVGGKGTYTFALNEEPAQDLNSFPGLPSGIYTVRVIDINGCEASLNNLLISADGFRFSATVVEDTQCVNSNGSIAIEVQEGIAPFRYKLSGGEFSDNNVFPGLSPGQYSITVEDAGSCNTQLRVTVPHGSTGTSWLNEVLPIIKTSCAINGCHDGRTRMDYRLYANAKKDMLQIKESTKNRSMPFDGPPLLQSQIDLIGCWVDDGGLDN